MAAPEVGLNKPVLRLTRGQAYSGLLRDEYKDERSPWEQGAWLK
jgi:hypothetical protein